MKRTPFSYRQGLIKALFSVALMAGPASAQVTHFAFVPPTPSAAVTYSIGSGVTFNVQAQDASNALVPGFTDMATVGLFDSVTGMPTDPQAILVDASGVTHAMGTALPFVGGNLNFGVTFEMGTNSEQVSIWDGTASLGQNFPGLPNGFIVTGYSSTLFLQALTIGNSAPQSYNYAGAVTSTDLLTKTAPSGSGVNYGILIPYSAGVSGSAAFAVTNFSGGFAYGTAPTFLKLYLQRGLPSTSPSVNYEVIVDPYGTLTDYDSPQSILAAGDSVYAGSFSNISTNPPNYGSNTSAATLVSGYSSPSTIMNGGQVIVRLWSESATNPVTMLYAPNNSNYSFINVPYSAQNVSPLRGSVSPLFLLGGAASVTLQYILLNEFSSAVTSATVGLPPGWTLNSVSDPSGKWGSVGLPLSGPASFTVSSSSLNIPFNASVTLSLNVNVPNSDGTWPFPLLSALGLSGNVPVNSSQDNVQSLGVPSPSAGLLGAPVSFNAGGGAVSLSWAPVTNESSSGYVLTRSPAGGPFGPVTLSNGTTFANAVVFSTSVTAYVDATAPNLMPVTYSLAAFNPVADGQAVSLGPVTAFANPGAPDSLSALTGGTTVQLSWNAPISVSGSFPVAGYQVFRDGTSIATTITSASAVTYQDTTGLASGNTYNYYVSAFDNAGSAGATLSAHNSGFSNPASGFPLGNPPAASGVSIASTSPATLVFSWTTPVNVLNAPISFYQVYKETGSGGFGSPISAAGTSYADSAVAIGNTYFYYVQAVDSLGVTSNPSATLQGQLGPSAPQSFLAVGGAAGITLTWQTIPSAPVSAASYVVFRSSSAGSTILSMAAGSGAAQTLIDTVANGLTQGINYSYYVAGVDTIPVTGAGSVTLVSDLLPAAPAGLTASYTANQLNAVISWTAAAVTNLTGYNLYRNTSPVTTGMTAVTLGYPGNLNGPVTDLTSLSAGTTYFYFLQALDSGGAGSFASAGFQMPPMAPTGLTGHSSSSAITLSWTPSAQAVSYTVYEDSPVSVALGPTNTTSYPITTGLSPGVNYIYQVTASDYGSGGAVTGGESFPSAPVTAGLVPAAPAGLGVTLSMSVSDTAVTFGGVAQNIPVSESFSAGVTWTAAAVTNLTGYNLFRNTAPVTGSGWVTVAQNFPVSLTTYTDLTSLSAGTTYYYFLQAQNLSGPGVFSMMGLLTPPAVPANLTGNSSGSAITLTWTPSAAAGSYNIQAISSGGVSSNILANSTSVTFTSLSPGTDYFFTVMTSDAGSGATILGGGPSAAATLVWGLLPQPVTITSHSVSLLSALNQTAVTVNWNPVTEANATGVSLLYGTTSNPVSATGVSFPVTASSGFVSLSPDSTYYFWVEGVNPYGSGPPTAPVSQSTYPAAVSLMPIGLAPDGTSRIINWTPQNSLSVTQYVIYREETAPIPSSWFAVTQFPGNVSLPVTLSMSLQPAVNYEEKVVAVNTTGTGPDSNYQPFSSLPLAPQAVTALSGISTASAAVSLSWADPSAAAEGVTLYTIYRSPSNAATNSYVSIGALPVPTLTPTFSYSDSSVTALGVYYYLIAAYADNEQTPLNTANAVGVTAFAAPNPPGAPTASPSNRTVALTWGAAVSTTYPVAGYNIYQSTSASVTGTLPVNATPVTSASFSVTGLVNGTTYYYWVGTVDSAGHPSDLSLSGPVSAEPLALPGAPGNMNAGGGNEAIQITWNPSTPGTLPIGGYQVFRSAAAPGGPYAPLTLLGANATGYVDDVPPLTIGTTYYYYVVAVDNSGITTGLDASADSVTVNGIPVTTAVNPPSGLLAAGGVSQVVLSWSDSFAGLGGPVTGYQIYRSTNPAATFTFLTTVAFGAGPVTDLAVANGTPYYYYFVAYSGGSASSDSATIFATPARPPSVPLGLAGVDGNASVTLGWTPNTPVDNVPVTQYVVYRDASAAITVYNAAATVDNTGLVNGNTYVYQIQAVNADGVTSGLSTPVADYPYILTAPAGLSSASGAASIVLSWTPPVTNSFPLGNYVLIRSLPGGGSPVTTSAASFPVTDTTVTQGELYVYTVQATDNKGHLGVLSGAVTDAACNPPAAPLTLTATAGDGQILVDFLPSPALAGSLPVSYYLLTGSDGVSQQLPATQTWFLDNNNGTGLADPTTVTYSLQAVDATGIPTGNHISVSAASAPATTDATLLNPPTGLTAKALSNSKVQLTWAQPNSGGRDVTGFNIYRGSSYGSYTMIGSVPQTVTTYADSAGLYANNTYYYVVRAVYYVAGSPNTESPNSNHAVLTLPQGANAPKVSSGQMAFDANLVLPLSGQKLGIYFVSPAGGPVAIKVYTIAGTLVRTLNPPSATANNPENLTWDMTDRNGSLVASGVYFIEMDGPGGFHLVKKVAVVK